MNVSSFTVFGIISLATPSKTLYTIQLHDANKTVRAYWYKGYANNNRITLLDENGIEINYCGAYTITPATEKKEGQ
jgi:hypothetical protein